MTHTRTHMHAYTYIHIHVHILVWYTSTTCSLMRRCAFPEEVLGSSKFLGHTCKSTSNVKCVYHNRPNTLPEVGVGTQIEIVNVIYYARVCGNSDSQAKVIHNNQQVDFWL